MLHVPSPLHPFAVHFPVVFLLVGSLCLLLAVWWRPVWLLRLAMATMVLGAAGTWWAHQTGLAAAAEVRFVAASVREVVQLHKAQGDTVLMLALLAAALSVAVWLAGRWRVVGLPLSLLAAGAGLVLLWNLQLALHTGSLLTHQHLFGPNAPKPAPGTEEVVRLRVP